MCMDRPGPVDYDAELRRHDEALPYIERAIELNGEAVAMNQAAFVWGRKAAADPQSLEAQLAPLRQPSATGMMPLSLPSCVPTQRTTSR